MPRDQQFDEIRVYEGVAERTGTTVDKKSVRRSQAFCRSVSELTSKARRMGDGYFYLASLGWPQDKTQLQLTQVWTPMG